MNCPNCGSSEKAMVKETRPTTDGGVRRRRRCPICFHDFETTEHISGDRLRVDRKSVV